MTKIKTKYISFSLASFFLCLLPLSLPVQAELNPFLPVTERIEDKNSEIEFNDNFSCMPNSFDMMGVSDYMEDSVKEMKYIGTMNGVSVYFDKERNINTQLD